MREGCISLSRRGLFFFVEVFVGFGRKDVRCSGIKDSRSEHQNVDHYGYCFSVICLYRVKMKLNITLLKILKYGISIITKDKRFYSIFDDMAVGGWKIIFGIAM